MLGALLRGPPAFQAATPWSAGASLVAGAAMFLAANFLGWLLALAYVEILHAGGGEVSPGPIPGGAGRNAGITIVWLFGTQIALTLLVLVVAGLFGATARTTLALRRPAQGWTVYPRALVGILALVGVFNALAWIAGVTDLLQDLRPFLQLMQSDAWPVLMLAIAIGAPASEELLFRGFLLPALAASPLGFRGAALVTTVMWTALHAGYSVLGVIEVFLIGLFFCWLFWRTGSLWVPIVCHAIYNTILLVVMFVLLPIPT